MLRTLVGCTLAPAFLAVSLAAQSPGPLRTGQGSPARVAYVSDELVDELFELFSVPTDGSTGPLRLSTPLPPGGDVGEILQVSGGRVLYVADALTDDVQELFVVADDGSTAPVRLSAPLPPSGDVGSFLAGPDFALFLADSNVDGRDELHRVPLDGSAPPVVLAPGLDVYRFHDLARDASRVLFSVNAAGFERLYAVRTDGSAAPVFLADPGTPTGFGVTYFPQAELTGDGARAVFMSAEDDDSFVRCELWSVRLDGTGLEQLNPGPRFGFTEFQLSPDGSHAVYIDTEVEGFVYSELVSARTDGSYWRVLTPGNGRPGALRIDDDSSSCVTAIYEGTSWSLRRARLDGSQSLELLAPAPGAIIELELAAGSTTIFLRDSRLHALATPGLAVPISDPGVTNAHTAGFPVLTFTPDRTRVLYRSDVAGNGVFDLWSARIDGSIAPVKLNPPLSGGRDVWDCRVTPDGRVLLRGDLNANNRFVLSSAPLDGSTAAVELNAPLGTEQDVVRYGRPRPAHRTRLP